jgi:hypothetical protein
MDKENAAPANLHARAQAGRAISKETIEVLTNAPLLKAKKLGNHNVYDEPKGVPIHLYLELFLTAVS